MVTTSSSIQTGFPRRIGPAEEMFGYERTIETVREGCAEEITAEDLVERLMSRARQFAGDEPQADDMTCVVVWVNGWGTSARRRLDFLQSPPTSQRIGISATRTGGHQTEIRSHILTLDVDTYVGAGQCFQPFFILYNTAQRALVGFPAGALLVE